MNNEWIEIAKKLHHNLRLYIECVEKYVQFGEYNTIEEERLLKQLDRLDEIEIDLVNERNEGRRNENE